MQKKSESVIGLSEGKLLDLFQKVFFIALPPKNTIHLDKTVLGLEKIDAKSFQEARKTIKCVKRKHSMQNYIRLSREILMFASSTQKNSIKIYSNISVVGIFFDSFSKKSRW